MNHVVLIEQGVKVNWSIVVFNNLYSRLRDLYTPTKPNTSRDNTEFETPRVVDILFRNWFPVYPTFILLKLDEGEEGAARPVPKAHAKGTIKVLKANFWCIAIDINEEMENIKEIGGMNT